VSNYSKEAVQAGRYIGQGLSVTLDHMQMISIIHNFGKKLISMITIVGISAAIAILSPTIFSIFTQVNATNPPEQIAQTPGGTTKPGGTSTQTQVTELERIYVTESAQGGLTEVRLAQLALQKSQNNNIRRYAQQMIQEHTPVNQQLVQLATQKGITPPTDVGPKYQAAIAPCHQGSDFL
jgi:putative membrane protein